FRRDLALALDLAARTSSLVTIGVPPTHPETGYGYIRTGAPVPGTRGRAVVAEAFIEKPDGARAAALLAGGDVLWNPGLLAWRATPILAALGDPRPAVLGPLERAGGRRLAGVYRRLPRISIDRGVLERAGSVIAVRARFPWSDVGSWAALAALRAGGDGRHALPGLPGRGARRRRPAAAPR